MSPLWIYRELHPLVHEANANAGWNYHWDWSEPCQFTKYDGSKKQHYDWHTDSGVKPNPNGKVRKLSMTVALVDGDQYEGGDFEIIGLKEPLPRLEKGTIIVFPSFIDHRVTPVTKGTRYSLVTWFVGPPFV